MKDGIIDSAVCLRVRNGTLDADAWLSLAASWGITHSVAAPSGQFVAVYNAEGNALMSDLIQRHPGKLSALAVANPWYGPKAVDMLRRAFDAGCCGLYLHPGRQGFHLTESLVDPLIELCIERDKPIYAYTGTPICAQPLQLAELARRFPQATFVLGHMGWSDFSGYDDIPAALQAPNIMLETSCTSGGGVRRAVDTVGAERVLFGSGYPRSHPAHEFEKIKCLGLSQRQSDLYLRGNALRIWKVQP